MARVTVEDCLTYVDNRFQLVLIASKRARQLSKNGALAHVAPENDKPTVLALREIAAGFSNFQEVMPSEQQLDEEAANLELTTEPAQEQPKTQDTAE